MPDESLKAQTVEAPAGASVSPADTAQAPAGASVSSDTQQPSVSVDLDKIRKENDRLQRLLKEQQAKSKELETATQQLSDEARVYKDLVRGRNVQDALASVGVRRPDLMAKLFEAKPEHFAGDHALTPDGKKALDEFVKGLGDEMLTKKTASTPAVGGKTPERKQLPATVTGELSGIDFVKSLWAKG
jgi:hypothetical protein